MRLLRILPILAALTLPLHADLRITTRSSFSQASRTTTQYYKGKQYRCDMAGEPGYQIVDLANGHSFGVDTAKREYSSMNASRAFVTAIDKSHSFVVNVHFRDTAEVRQMFGYTARHVITTQTHTEYLNGKQMRSSERTTDGWYLDIPGDYPMSGKPGAVDVLGFGVVGGTVTMPEVKITRSGPAPRGLPVWEKTGDDVREVIELSEAPLDESLFQPPPGFRRVECSFFMPARQLSWIDQIVYYWRQFEEWLNSLS